MSGTDDKELKRKVDDLREKNEVLGLAIQRSRHAVKRLKLEYGVLLERLETRIELDPLLRFENPLPTLSAFKKELLEKPMKRTKTKRQKAKERDPNMPKRPTNAYLIYCEMNKEKVKSLGSSDVTRDLTEGWKSLDEEGRAPYYKLYNEDRNRYRQEMEIYNKRNEDGKVKNSDDEEEEDEEEEDEEEEDDDGDGEETEAQPREEEEEDEEEEDDDDDDDDEEEEDADRDQGDDSGDKDVNEEETMDTQDENESENTKEQNSITTATTSNDNKLIRTPIKMRVDSVLSDSPTSKVKHANIPVSKTETNKTTTEKENIKVKEENNENEVDKDRHDLKSTESDLGTDSE
ncbi:non-histone protein [Maudiozyma exigua]|uniref:Non-histone protein n=1 Tax=Maudiozyma exigua TaxID=34358 RepID=A0A9P6WCP2_MAUEX|nr:non-histone protein [Kazachstania exigua]